MVENRFQAVLDGLAAEGNSRRFRGVPSGGKVVNLSSNDYLGVAGNLAWQAEFFEQIQGLEGIVGSSKKGVMDPTETGLLGSTSSRLLAGTHPAHTALESTLTELYGRPALTFSTGYQMNTGILPAIADSQTLILADKLCHASIIDGLRLCNCQVIRYLHHSYDQLERLVAQNASKFQHIIVVTESVFSMDGDVTPLHRLAALRRAYCNVMLYVDEAHALGIFGPRGLGIAAAAGVLDQIDFLCGTFGKALGGVGGFVVCSPVMRDFLINRCRTLIFTTALPPINALWSHFVLRKMTCGELENSTKKLLENSQFLRQTLTNKGYPMPSESQIVPLILGPSKEAVRMSEMLERSGFYALPIRPPTVPEGASRLRFSLTSMVQKTDLQNLIKLL